MPLQLATLPGKQEIVLKFTEMNQVNKVSYKKSVKLKKTMFYISPTAGQLKDGKKVLVSPQI